MLIPKSFSIEGKGGYSLMKKEKTTIVVAGVLIGVIAAMLVFFGNPANMGFCIACFLRDTTGALGLHSAAAVQYIRPEIIGLAGDKDEAVDMVVEIIQEVYDATGDFRIEEYWKNR